ncbi:hypothetical protein ABENE_10675 [Asticcacaulis benevestitus DSM 16100 = ATCC BAA-896]|uniref:Uncharacterized protein n=1 Tax=Asticcacaulis benevestitus DSM 16100 = ATCC BAA-896 TaxID=1121022 RepID=V4RIH2_9CAUL|nr:hypothetical protein ABENE_10675 [Asticcacaulis benevestitus DSM 16100 = ATCC BAA-896]
MNRTKLWQDKEKTSLTDDIIQYRIHVTHTYPDRADEAIDL